MLIAGIIAEYNPFHNGHSFHVAETRRRGADAVVAVMSSNFVQRGEAAIMPKYARAEAAVRSGIDLVIELPTVWSCANAQRFGSAGTFLLDALGCVDILSFGSECGNAELISAAADAVEDDDFGEHLKKHLERGITFAAAREAAVREMCGDSVADILRNPNDTLATEYLLSLRKIRSQIKPLAVKRFGAMHDSDAESGKNASASHIRELIYQNGEWEKLMPKSSARVLSACMKNGTAPSDGSRLETSLLLKLREKSAQDIARLPDVSEGLENRIFDAARKAVAADELYDAVKTKRYTHARIRRIALHALLGINDELQKKEPQYIRVLAFNEKGREVLKESRKTAKLPIITRASDIKKCGNDASEIFDAECRASDIFAMTLPKPLPCGAEFTENIFIDIKKTV